MQEEVPDTRGLDPGDVGGRAGKDAGLVLHGAADWPEAHHAVHLPAVPAQLAQQRPARVALKRRDTTSFKKGNSQLHLQKVSSSSPGPHLAGSRWIFFVPETCADHGVSHAVAPELLLPAGLEVDDGQPGLVEGFCQGHVLLPA